MLKFRIQDIEEKDPCRHNRLFEHFFLVAVFRFCIRCSIIVNAVVIFVKVLYACFLFLIRYFNFAQDFDTLTFLTNQNIRKLFCHYRNDKCICIFMAKLTYFCALS